MLRLSDVLSGDSTATVRMDAMSSENMKAYFDLLSDVYDEFDFGNHSKSIYDMDETGVRCCTSGQKSQATVIGCGSASGQILPPFIIFAVKQLNHSWTKHEVSGSCYGVSDKGWVDQGLFHHWLKVHFLVNAVSRRPLLLLLDGHSSHFEPQSIEFAKENGVVIFVFHHTPRMSSSPLTLVFLDHSRSTGSKNAIGSTKATRLVF